MLSVRLMTYMHEKYIKQAMDSIMMQKTNFDVEVVVGDDFSSDRTLEIIKSYKDNKHIHINILNRQKGDEYWKKRQKLGRLYNFINIIENCSGKYIALLDGDDYWSDTMKLQKQVDFLEQNNDFVGVFHNVSYIDERDESKKPKPWREYDRDIFNAEDTFRKISLFHISSYCFRNLDYDYNLIYDNISTSADIFILGLISKFGKLKLIDEQMSVYRINLGSITSGESKIKYHNNRIALNQALNTYFEYKYDQEAEAVIKFHKSELKRFKYPKIHKAKKKIKNKLSNITKK